MQQRPIYRWLGSLLTLGLLALSSPASLEAAPPGWELRNGSWVPVIQPDPTTPEGQVAGMIRDLEQGQVKEVIDNAKDWLKANAKNPLVPQVLLLQGDAEVAQGNKYKALYPLEELVNNFPTSELYPAVLQREFDIAEAFLKGYKRKFLAMRILPVTDDAIELLDRIQDRQRGSPLAERAGMRVADHHYQHGEFTEALDAYSDFLRRYPYSQYARKAEVRRAECSLATFHGILFDITPLMDGRERLVAIAQAYPQTAETLQIPALEDRIYQVEGQKELEVARYYWRASRKHASAYYYKRVIATWPDTTFAQEARQELARRFPNEVSK